MTWLPSIALRPSFDTTNLSWSVLRNSQNALLPATASDANYGLLNDISPLWWIIIFVAIYAYWRGNTKHNNAQPHTASVWLLRHFYFLDFSTTDGVPRQLTPLFYPGLRLRFRLKESRRERPQQCGFLLPPALSGGSWQESATLLVLLKSSLVLPAMKAS